MGKLLGVSLQTIYHWEKGQSRPRASQLQGIAEMRKLGKRGAAARLAEV
jgi:DNA-binding XRE family transcriptional regulator